MAKTGEQATKQIQKTQAGWVETMANKDVEAVVVELEARCHGLNGASAVFVQVEGKMDLILKELRRLQRESKDKDAALDQMQADIDALKAEKLELEAAVARMQPEPVDGDPATYLPIPVKAEA